MPFQHSIYSIKIETFQLQLIVPDPFVLKQVYGDSNQNIPFPYWAKIWPAAKALSKFIVHNKQLILEKQVMEIAAGLGLPSIVASSFAKKIYATDAIPDAIEFMKLSIQLNRLSNIKTGLYNWHEPTNNFEAEVLLMSDVNYNPADFPQLLSFIQTNLKKGATILLSTPQRLMAKPFIQTLEPYIIYREDITDEEEDVLCTVFVLKTN
jgi:predicted nicotinamide N-methyase